MHQFGGSYSITTQMTPHNKDAFDRFEDININTM